MYLLTKKICSNDESIIYYSMLIKYVFYFIILLYIFIKRYNVLSNRLFEENNLPNRLKKLRNCSSL